MKKVPTFEEFENSTSFRTLVEEFGNLLAERLLKEINSPEVASTRDEMIRNEKIDKKDFSRFCHSMGKNHPFFFFEVGKFVEFTCSDYAPKWTIQSVIEETDKVLKEFCEGKKLLFETKETPTHESPTDDNWHEYTIEFFKHKDRGQLAGKKLGITENEATKI